MDDDHVRGTRPAKIACTMYKDVLQPTKAPPSTQRSPFRNVEWNDDDTILSCPVDRPSAGACGTERNHMKNSRHYLARPASLLRLNEDWFLHADDTMYVVAMSGHVLRRQTPDEDEKDSTMIREF